MRAVASAAGALGVGWSASAVGRNIMYWSSGCSCTTVDGLGLASGIAIYIASIAELAVFGGLTGGVFSRLDTTNTSSAWGAEPHVSTRRGRIVLLGVCHGLRSEDCRLARISLDRI